MQSSVAGVETVAKAVATTGHCGSRAQASRPLQGRPRQILAAGFETAAREAGHCGVSRPPASRPWRGRRATSAISAAGVETAARDAATDLGHRRRDGGEGGWPKMLSSVAACVETVAKAAGHRRLPPQDSILAI